MQTSGNEIFYRNPYDVNECLFVNMSSPSSSKYTSLKIIGSPDKVADKARRQYLRELMSTRLGVRRESEIVSASDRTGADGNEYYDLQVRLLPSHPLFMMNVSSTFHSPFIANATPLSDIGGTQPACLQVFVPFLVELHCMQHACACKIRLDGDSLHQLKPRRHPHTLDCMPCDHRLAQHFRVCCDS